MLAFRWNFIMISTNYDGLESGKYSDINEALNSVISEKSQKHKNMVTKL